jgi:hypothetical protein
LNQPQKSLFKADTYVRAVAESGILGLVLGNVLEAKGTGYVIYAAAHHQALYQTPALSIWHRLSRGGLRKP